jgi:putative PEP-CTERM system histidine kinase
MNELGFLESFSLVGHVAGAIICVIAAFWIVRNGDRERSDRLAMILAIAFTGSWCLISAIYDPTFATVQYSEISRNLSWILLIFRLFANDGRDASMGAVRPVIIVLGFVELLQMPLLYMKMAYVATPETQALAFEISAMLRMMTAIGALVLLHNLYVGATANSRQLLRWSSTALAIVWGFDLNLYTITYLGGEPPAMLFALRGFLAVGLAIALAISSNSDSLGLQFNPSRAVTFRGLSLIIIAVYLFVMVFITQSLALLGGDLARLTQVGFFVFASVVAILWLPSARLRSWLKHSLSKHMFQHRYDYREEWLRFTETIGRGGSKEQSLYERSIKAMADITDSPAGLLLAPDEEARLGLAARWNWRAIDVPGTAAEYDLSGYLEESSVVLDLDQIRAGEDRDDDRPSLPQWLLDTPDAWALVPLLHFDRLVGAVVLARPNLARRLDWEDLDLLRVVGQQLASYLAEQSVQQALMEASRFDEFNRRIAFVMHDVKNLASQLTLLARNAEKHADNPDFRSDMLVTLRNSADKLNALLARLGRYGTGQAVKLRSLDLAEIARRLEQRFNTLHKISVTSAEKCEVTADEESLEQALTHLVQNAIDASEKDNPILVEVYKDGIYGRIDVIDKGAGMSPAFIRNGLFKPFISSKNNGFGIGAFEARELIRAMDGRLEVESQEGLGSRFSAFLPLSAAKIISSSKSDDQTKVA